MKYVFVLMVFSTLSGVVSASSQLKKAISDTASSIQLKIYDTQADDTQLTEALRLLESSLLIISSQSGGSDPACVEWAYGIYYQSQSASTAQKNAAAACRGGVDLEIAKWLYAKYYQSLSSAISVDRATAGARRAQGKLPIIEFAYGKYYQSHSSSESATKAADGAKLVLSSAKVCLERAYSIHYQSHSSSAAMDLAFQDCR